ncbi:alpha/beta hydrolase [Lentilactobacillus diolivorans]|uniref:Carboxylesterase n=2 Tax=Lentilactobacillus diolivorans TaxID=179838 RepID=A0A0R1S7L2_9LACO|nr:alpha/beta fold hydrolase [Lentilactobacillus diolivorans]KRL64478.1 carboxylesterase [Lentilactobacillus diolivorans DSM 14421]GEP23026.1 carboxylesterase [Lentilactobacillus diolivorans]
MQSPTKSFYFEHGPKGIVLLHAFASGPVDVRLLARRLERSDYTIYAPLLTGHGTPDFSDILLQGSPERWWQDTQNAIQFLHDKGINQISIFGISLGGIFAAKALENDSDLVGGGSLGSPIVRKREFSVHNTFMQMAKANFVRYKTNEAIMNTKLDWLDANIDQLLAKISAFSAGVADDLPKIKRPYFIGQGLNDEIVNPASAKQVRDQLVNSDVSYHEYPNATHMITVNSAHQQLEADLSEFLTKLYE